MTVERRTREGALRRGEVGNLVELEPVMSIEATDTRALKALIASGAPTVTVYGYLEDEMVGQRYTGDEAEEALRNGGYDLDEMQHVSAERFVQTWEKS